MTLIFKFEKQEWFDHILKSSVGDVSLCFSLHEIVVMIHCLSKQRILFLHLNKLQQLFCYIIVVFVPVFLEYVKTLNEVRLGKFSTAERYTNQMY